MPILLTPRLLGWLALMTGLAAPTRPQEAPKVKVTVVVILGNNRSTEVDPRLKQIAAEVEKCTGLTSYTLASMTTKSLAVNEKAVFPLNGDKTSVTVVVQQAADQSNKVCLAVTPPQQGEIVYRTVCGKFLPIVTRCQSCEYILPANVIRAMGSATAPCSTAPILGAGVAFSGKTRERLILAIRVQPCNGK